VQSLRSHVIRNCHTYERRRPVIQLELPEQEGLATPAKDSIAASGRLSAIAAM
jgi:hypothetical protein